VSGAIRSQPQFEETGAVTQAGRGLRDKYWRFFTARGNALAFDTGRLMGVRFVDYFVEKLGIQTADIGA
jgi:hypothetical protein